MITFTLQVATAILTTLFGITALKIAGTPGPVMARPAWRLVGGGFVLVGGSFLAHNAFGAVVLARGEAPITELYMAMSPAFSHSRAMALVATFPLLLVVTRPPADVNQSDIPRAWVLVGIGYASGILLGAIQGPRETATHWPIVSIVFTVELVVLLCTLFVLLVRDRVDRHLWLALAVFALKLTSNALWLSLYSRSDIPGAWYPPLRVMHVNQAVLSGIIALIALRRLQLARRGSLVPTVYGSLR